MQTVIGLFNNAQDAQKAAQQLVSEGFADSNVDVSVSSAGKISTGNSADNDSSDLGNTSGMTSRDSADTSAISSNANTRNDDNDDSFGEKVSRFFKNLFGSDDDNAERYSHVASSTRCIVTVHAQSRDEAERAADVLDNNGAIDVDQYAGGYANQGTTSGMNTGMGDESMAGSSTGMGAAAGTTADWGMTSDDGINSGAGMASSAGMTAGAAGMSSDDDVTSGAGMSSGAGTTTGANMAAGAGMQAGNAGDKLNVIKEDVQIGKREVEKGSVRLRSRIVERPIQEELRLRDEEVTVQRNPVDRPATTSDFENFKEGTVEMTAYAEVPEVQKQARVVEEVQLNKQVNERTENINETARDTEVVVEDTTRKDGTNGANV